VHDMCRGYHFIFLTAPYQVHVEEKTIGNAMELRMKASEIDAGRE